MGRWYKGTQRAAISVYDRKYKLDPCAVHHRDKHLGRHRPPRAPVSRRLRFGFSSLMTTPVFVVVIRSFLTAHHDDTFVALDASSTIAAAHAHKPDLIILDLRLPTETRSESILPLPEAQRLLPCYGKVGGGQKTSP
jgi:hypothetical protein